jgi:hypothetical protein
VALLVSVRLAARTLLQIAALICFVVAAVAVPSTSGRPVLTWIAAGLAFLTVAWIVDSVHISEE